MQCIPNKIKNQLYKTKNISYKVVDYMGIKNQTRRLRRTCAGWLLGGLREGERGVLLDGTWSVVCDGGDLPHDQVTALSFGGD